jgi:hypothetical protein
MKCLRPLECWDCRFESHLRHDCLCVRFTVFVLSCVVAALRPADPPSKESYRLYWFSSSCFFLPSSSPSLFPSLPLQWRDSTSVLSNISMVHCRTGYHLTASTVLLLSRRPFLSEGRGKDVLWWILVYVDMANRLISAKVLVDVTWLR